MRHHGHGHNGGHSGAPPAVGGDASGHARAEVKPLDPDADPAVGRHLKAGDLLEFAKGRLRLKPEGAEEWIPVIAVRMYPLSEWRRWISILDDTGRVELCWIERLDDVPEPSRLAIEAELDQRYVTPVITRILECRELSPRERIEIVEWRVETNRGPMRFVVKHSESIKQPHSGALMITDVEGRRFDIPDVDALDANSQRLLRDRT